MLTDCQFYLKEHISVKFYLRFKVFIQENAFENVICEMRPLCLSLNVFLRPNYVNMLQYATT